MIGASAETVVFVGPSLGRNEARRLLPEARVEPPVGRGDLDRLRAAGVGRFVIIDGAFGHELAVAPSEIVAALRGGSRVIGAASMGAIRAAECRPGGMTGIGTVYGLYRWRVIADDDEVAVATEPGRGFAATSTALINIRLIVLAGMRRRLVSRAEAEAVLGIAKQTHFSERHYETAFRAAGVPLGGALRGLCESTDVKRADAIKAIQTAAKEKATCETAAQVRSTAARAVSGPRYPGHDTGLGRSPEALRVELTRWLLGSGRYARHGGSSRPDPAKVWEALRSTGELETELMRWYAVRRWAEIDRTPPDTATLRDARDEIATRHGYEGWEALVVSARTIEQGSIPVSLIEEACWSLALARRNMHEQPDPLSSRVGCLM